MTARMLQELALETLELCAGERFEEEQDLWLSSGKTKIQLPLEAREITACYQKFAKIMVDFLKNLREQSKSTPYPEQELSKAWQEA